MSERGRYRCGWRQRRACGLFFFEVVWSIRGSVLPAAFEPVAFAVHLQDVDVLGEPFRAEDLGPLVEGQVGDHHDRALFAALGEYLGEQLRAGVGQRHEAANLLMVYDLVTPLLSPAGA